MKLHNTLIITFILLILYSFNTYSDELSDKNAACNAALNQGNFTSASKLADEVLNRDAMNREGLICKGRLQGAQGNFDDALNTLKLAETLSKESLDHIIGHILIGNVYKAQQKYSDAIASYESSLVVAKVDKNEKFIRANHNLIGDIHSNAQDYNAALTSYDAGSKLAMNDNERADSYERMAATYSALGQNDSAIEYQIKGVQMEQKSGTLDSIANANLVLGNIYMHAKEYTNAEKTYSKLLQFSKDNGGAYYEAKSDFCLAQAKAANGDNNSANALFTEAKRIAKDIGASDLIAEFEAKSK